MDVIYIYIYIYIYYIYVKKVINTLLREGMSNISLEVTIEKN